jgi:hypothetical protein
MKFLLFCALTLSLPAAASEFLCLPDRICVPGSCTIAINEGSAIRLTYPDSVAPLLESHGETIPMEKTFQRNGQSEWQGVNAAGEYEALYLDRDRLDFTYWIGDEPVRFVEQVVRYRSVGTCEEQ